MKILTTGATGFLGKYITDQLKENPLHDVKDINDLSGCRINIATSFQLEKNYNADIIVHIAGKAHLVPRNREEVAEFYSVNFEGTKNLCKAIEDSQQTPVAFVFISTVAVYGLEAGKEIGEETPLLGNTPYAKSKIEAESFLLNWGKKNNIPILILRLPLIAGNNPPGNLGKMIGGIETGKYLSINKGKAKRSVILAKDVTNCILENFGKEGIYNLSDGYHPSFRELETVICKQLNKNLPFSLPMASGKLVGKIGDVVPFFPVNSDTIEKMSNDLTFSNKKALSQLNWKPLKVIDHFKI